jgi:hypothetical protein
MVKKNKVRDVFDKYKYDRNSVTRSRSWFSQQLTLLKAEQIQRNRLLKPVQAGLLKDNIIPGRMYMFVYDPKYKKTLPYYDVFPLVFPFAKTPNGFLALNMHYLPYPLRIMLMDRLMTYASDKSMDEMTKIKFSWATIARTARFNLAKPCIKEYLMDNVKSQFRLVPASDWFTALMLPVEGFQKASTVKVWAESRKRIK